MPSWPGILPLKLESDRTNRLAAIWGWAKDAHNACCRSAYNTILKYVMYKSFAPLEFAIRLTPLRLLRRDDTAFMQWVVRLCR